MSFVTPTAGVKQSAKVLGPLVSCYRETIDGCIIIFIGAESISQLPAVQLLICKCSTCNYFEHGVNVIVQFQKAQGHTFCHKAIKDQIAMNQVGSEHAELMFSCIIV